MLLKGMVLGKECKLTVDTLLDQFRKAYGNAKTGPGELNFVLEWQLTAQSDCGSFQEAEQQLNSFLGAARCLNDKQPYDLMINVSVIDAAQRQIMQETSRSVQAQMAIAAPEQEIQKVTPKLVLP